MSGYTYTVPVLLCRNFVQYSLAPPVARPTCIAFRTLPDLPALDIWRRHCCLFDQGDLRGPTRILRVGHCHTTITM